ncbi:MAG: hypothetical protein ACRC9Q_10860 [Bacteroidales bacterium]
MFVIDMRQTQRTHPIVIRFRRWSRKSYAIFCGLGKQISIGRLSCGIADLALSKNQRLAGKTDLLSTSSYPNPHEFSDSDHEEHLVLTLLSDVCMAENLPAVSSFASSYLNYNKINTNIYKAYIRLIHSRLTGYTLFSFLL